MVPPSLTTLGTGIYWMISGVGGPPQFPKPVSKSEDRSAATDNAG